MNKINYGIDSLLFVSSSFAASSSGGPTEILRCHDVFSDGGKEFRVLQDQFDELSAQWIQKDQINGDQTSGVIGEANDGGNADAFILKLSAGGAPQWATQLGAVTRAPGASLTANQSLATCRGISTDATGNIYCAGGTSGEISEANGGGSEDAFMLKLSPSGVIQWATQLGASTFVSNPPLNPNQGTDICLGVAVDLEGSVICAGTTDGNLSEGEAGGPNGDAFVWKLKSNGTF